GKPGKTIRNTLVLNSAQQRVPAGIELDISGPEYRLQPRCLHGGGQIAAQVCPSLARHLCLRRHDAVERAADRGEVERDPRERLALELAVGDDGRTEVSPARVGKAGISR